MTEFDTVALPGRRNLRQVIEECGGVVQHIAVHFDVTRQTVYNWLDHYKMRPELTASRQKLRTVAGDVIYDRLMSEDEDKAFEAARFTFLHVANNGELLQLSPEVLRILMERGHSVEDIIKQFEQLVLMSAMESRTNGRER